MFQVEAASDGDVALIDVTMTEDARGRDSPLLIPTNDASSSEDDLESGSVERSNVRISMAAGISAQWRRNTHKIDRASTQHSTSGGGGTSAQSQGDVASLDSASASTDSVLIALNDDDESLKVSTTDLSQIPGTDSLTTTTNTSNRGSTMCNLDQPPGSAIEQLGSDGESSILSTEAQDDTQLQMES